MLQAKLQRPSPYRDQQSRTQSSQASWSAGGRWESLWGNRVLTAGILDSGEVELRLSVVSFVTVNSQSTAMQKNQNFSHYSRVSPGDHPLTKKPEDSGYEVADDLIETSTTLFLLHRSSHRAKYQTLESLSGT